MDAPVPSLTDKLSLAKNDRVALSRLLEEYMPFIRKCVSGVFFKPSARREHLSMAMLAFIHGVQTYKSENGAFIPFARVVIRNRLLDEIRREERESSRFVPFFSKKKQSDKDETEDGTVDYAIAERREAEVAERAALQGEIAEVSQEFSLWGFDWATLARVCPKQKRTRSQCEWIARAALLEPGLVDEMLKTKRLPVKRLSALTGCKEKIFEKYRPYIAALIVIIRGQYPYLHTFIPDFWTDEDRTFGEAEA
jgi:RNA polymerase sigma factor